MKTYEGLFIIESNAASERFNHVQTTLADAITQHGGTVLSSQEMGQQSLCYPIKKQTDGFYYLMTFSLDPAHINAVRQQMFMVSDVLRFLITLPPSRVEVPASDKESQTHTHAEGE